MKDRLTEDISVCSTLQKVLYISYQAELNSTRCYMIVSTMSGMSLWNRSESDLLALNTD